LEHADLRILTVSDPRRRARILRLGISSVSTVIILAVWAMLHDAPAASREHAVMIATIAGVATILLAGLAVYLMREIGHRTEQEIELTTERGKLQEANHRLEAEVALRREIEHDAVDSIPEGLVIYDSSDCFVMSNEPYRQLYPEAAHLMTPGTPFEENMSGRARCRPLCRGDRMRTGMARRPDLCA